MFDKIGDAANILYFLYHKGKLKLLKTSFSKNLSKPHQNKTGRHLPTYSTKLLMQHTISKLKLTQLKVAENKWFHLGEVEEKEYLEKDSKSNGLSLYLDSQSRWFFTKKWTT